MTIDTTWDENEMEYDIKREIWNYERKSRG